MEIGNESSRERKLPAVCLLSARTLGRRDGFQDSVWCHGDYIVVPTKWHSSLWTC